MQYRTARQRADERVCQHPMADVFCMKVTCPNGRFGWALLLGFIVAAGLFVWLGTAMGFIPDY